MKNADMRAMPFQEVTGMIGGVTTGYRNHKGLTKREEIIARFMAAFLSNPSVASAGMNYDAALLFEDAERYADAFFNGIGE